MVPPRRPLAAKPAARPAAGGFTLKPPPAARGNGQAPAPQPRPESRSAASVWGPVAELQYGIPSHAAEGRSGREDAPDSPDAGARRGQLPQSAGPYEPWTPDTVSIPGAKPHPTALVQSAAMAAVSHPRPAYRPKLPVNVVAEGRLSDAQLESVILAGQAHERRLPARYRIGETWETLRGSKSCARQCCGRRFRSATPRTTPGSHRRR